MILQCPRHSFVTDDQNLSRTISHALRHEPWLYELELDAEGWVPVDQLIEALRKERPEWAMLTYTGIGEMIERSDKKRHEICAGKIRAFYGHSGSKRLQFKRERPPAILYHGTAGPTAEIIRAEGLKPMSRNYVHLSTDVETALKVGKRKAKEPTVLEISSGLAHDAGTSFYRGSEWVWLADTVPGLFVK
jgi:putative RNA 2'-phosphotransferase